MGLILFISITIFIIGDCAICILRDDDEKKNCFDKYLDREMFGD